MIKLNVFTPEDLLKWMSKNIEYGWLDGKKIRTDFKEDFSSKYRLLQPNDVYKYKIGICQDQALFEHYIFTTLKFKIEDIKIIFIQWFYGSTHTFLVYKIDGKWFHFENSYYKMKGIHGPYSNIDKIIDNINKTTKIIYGYDKGFKTKEIDPDNLYHENIDIVKFLKICDYDFKKQEHTY